MEQKSNFKDFQFMILDKKFILIVLTIVCIGIILIVIGIYNGTISKNIIFQQIRLFAMAIFLGILFSNLTEKFFSSPAERLMNIATGFGFKNKDAEYDEKGVPIISLRRLKKKYYNPVTVSMTSFQHYENWQKTKDERYLEYFKNCADSLINNLKIKVSNKLVYGVWEYNYPWSYNLNPPWISGLAQGIGVHALSQAYKLTGKEKYLETAKSALNAFFIEIKDGGVTHKDNEDEWWYEEYVGENAKISRVLNGMIYALIGIHEYHKNTNDQRAKILLNKGVKSLIQNLSKYDAGWWTYYDNLGLIATRTYHIVHLELIKKMYKITGEKMFLKTYHQWARYKTKFFVREFIKQKPSWHDMAILGLNIISTFVLLEVIIFLIKL